MDNQRFEEAKREIAIAIANTQHRFNTFQQQLDALSQV